VTKSATATGTSAALVPPRPNLGPEPLDETRPPWALLIGLGIAGSLLGSWAWRRWRRPRRSRGLEPPGSPGSGESTAASTKEPIVAQATAARDALVARFGPAWRAKTTEEIAADPAPVEAFGTEMAERLVALFREADRAKFATARLSEAGPQRADADEWALWVAAFVASAGATSTIKGK
jgi:hypothetical protein